MMSLSTTALLALIAIVTATGETGEQCLGFVEVVVQFYTTVVSF